MTSQVQGEFAAREDAAKELNAVTDRLQGGWHLQEDERDMLLRKQLQLTSVLEQHSTQVLLLLCGPTATLNAYSSVCNKHDVCG